LACPHQELQTLYADKERVIPILKLRGLPPEDLNLHIREYDVRVHAGTVEEQGRPADTRKNDRDLVFVVPRSVTSYELGTPSQLGFQRASYRTVLVHNGARSMAKRAVRQSVSLPADVAAQVRRLAKTRRLSANRMLVELSENGMEAEKRKQQEFFDLAERFRSATDPDEVKRLGERMSRMVFGG
jgi:predicted DNA-binding ribbon-helix-helix protein